MVALSLPAFKEQMEMGCSVLDMRSPAEFASGFIPGSIFFSEGISLEVISAFVKKSDPLVIVGDHNNASLKAGELTASGFKVAGIFRGKVEDWKAEGNAVDLVIEVDTDELAMDLRFDKSLVVVDLRGVEEFQQSHIAGAVNIPVNELTDLVQIAALDEEGSVYFYGTDDADAMTAASWMKKHGLHSLRVIRGGWSGIVQEKGIAIGNAPEKNDGNQ